MRPPKFHIGQAVVCVAADKRLGHPYTLAVGVKFPNVGNVYTVRDIRAQEGVIGLFLEEIANPVVRCATPITGRFSGYHEPGFLAGNFAPVELLPAEALAELLKCLEPAHA